MREVTARDTCGFGGAAAKSVDPGSRVTAVQPTGGANLIGQKCNLCQKALFYKAFSVF